MGIARNTVSQYLKLPAAEIHALQESTARGKKLDDYRDTIIHLLQPYPGLSAVKVRRYIQALKQEISLKQARYYEPVCGAEI